MIYIAGSALQHPPNINMDEMEAIIFDRLKDDPRDHFYRSQEEMVFDIRLRRHIAAGAKALNQSEASFEIFTGTRANPAFWTISNAGGMRLGYGVMPSEAIEDIFRSSKDYGFECATAMIIIFYYAALRVIGKEAFNTLFPNIYLYSWHMDSDFGLESVRTTHVIPGDVVYFNNPDFHVQSPQWRGENAVVLDGGRFFGHGIGITSKTEMIQNLNNLRNPGSEQSAYLTNVVTRADSRNLFQNTIGARNSWMQKVPSIVIQHNENSISHSRYLQFLHGQ